MSGEPFPHPSHECSGEPILDAWTNQSIKEMPGATTDEIVEEVLRIATGGAQWTAYDRRMTEEQVRAIIAESRPVQYVTLDEIEAMRATLPEGRNGTLSIARALNVSEATVKRRLREKR